MDKILKNKFVPFVLFLLISVLFLFFGLLANTPNGSIAQQIDFKDLPGIMCFILLLITIILALLNIGYAIYVLIKQRLFLEPFIINAILLTIMLFIGGFNKVIDSGHTVVAVFIYILIGVGIAYYILRRKNNAPEISKNELPKENKASFIKVFIINAISTFILLINLFIPLFSFDGEDILLIRGLFYAQSIFELVVAIVYLLFLTVSILLTLSMARYLKYKNNSFPELSKTSIYYNFALSTAFLITGIIGSYVWANYMKADKVSSIVFIQFLLISVITTVHAFVNSPNIAEKNKNKKLNKKISLAIFSFTTVFTAITFISLFISLVSISNPNNELNFIAPDTSITGWDLLINPGSKGNSSLPLSFVVLAIIVISSVLYILSLTALFSKSNEVKRIALASIFTNFIFVLVLGLFGKAYEITYQITKENLLEYFNNKYPSFTSIITSKDPVINSQVFYMIFIDTAIAILMFIFKPFTKADNELVGSIELANTDPLNVNVENQPATTDIGEEKKTVFEFDSCPSFTEIDNKEEEYKRELEIRRTKLFQNPSLPSLVNFIVDYARESRLHLSYTPEDIASFIAGLGSTKLLILQGMSGTGKTSLPKIFCEALMGNCEIIEVESSWKDKNELLGYYNEFSELYTPKKFTRALYKASLNPEVTTLIVLDEMNLSRIEYYFSDFLSLMENEPEKRNIQLTNNKLRRISNEQEIDYLSLKDGHTLHVSENVWFIGTANRDESTFEISDKVYDRAFTMNFNKRAPKVRNYSQPIDKRFLPFEMLSSLLESAVNHSIFDLESVPYISEVEQLLRPYNISFGNRIMNQIEAYVKIYSACFNDSIEAKNDAIETILLSKVVAKLEFKAVEDKEELIRKFDKLKLYKCSEFIKRLSEDI